MLLIIEYASALLNQPRGLSDGQIAMLVLCAALVGIVIMIGCLVYLSIPDKRHPLNPFKDDD